MSSSGNTDTESGLSTDSQEVRDDTNGSKSKITKRSVALQLIYRDRSPYMVTGATDTQRQIPEFLTGRIHSNPNLERQESTHNVSLDTTLPAPDSEVPETPPRS